MAEPGGAGQLEGLELEAGVRGGPDTHWPTDSLQHGEQPLPGLVKGMERFQDLSSTPLELSLAEEILKNQGDLKAKKSSMNVPSHRGLWKAHRGGQVRSPRRAQPALRTWCLEEGTEEPSAAGERPAQRRVAPGGR